MGYIHTKKHNQNLLILLSTLSLNPYAFQGPIPEKNQKCLGSKLDLTYVVDGSASVGYETFVGHVTDMLKSIAYQFDIGPDTHHLAYIQFATNAQIEFNYMSDRDAVIEAIGNVMYMRGHTYLVKGLEKANQLIKDHSRKSEGVTQMVLVMSDGQSENPELIKPAADTLKSMGVEIFALGYAGASRGELEKIASPDRIMMGSNLDALEGFMDSMVEKICESATPPTVTHTGSKLKKTAE